MEVVLGLALEAVAAGVRRALRRPNPIVRVRPTYWLSVAVVALAAQTIVVALLAYALTRAFLTAWSDDLLVFLWIIIGPIAIFGIAICLAVIGWLIGVLRRTLAFDAYARFEIAAAGIGGAIVSLYALGTVWSLWGALLLAASACAIIVAVVPWSWREVRVEYPFIG